MLNYLFLFVLAINLVKKQGLPCFLWVVMPISFSFQSLCYDTFGLCHTRITEGIALRLGPWFTY